MNWNWKFRAVWILCLGVNDMSREMKDSGVEWIGEIPKNWNVQRVKNAFVRKKAEAHQENPVVLSLARAGVKVRDLSKNEGQIAESYYNYNLVEFGDLIQWIYTVVLIVVFQWLKELLVQLISIFVQKVAIVQDSMIITLKHSTGQWQCLHMGKVFLLRIDGP